MSALKISALAAIVILLASPFAMCLAVDSNGDGAAPYEEVKDATHIKFKDLNETDLAVLLGAGEGNDVLSPEILITLYEIMMPGINPKMVEDGVTKDIKIENASVELEYAHQVNDTKTNAELKIALSVSIDKMTIVVDLKDVKKDLEEAEKTHQLSNLNSVIVTSELKYYLTYIEGGPYAYMGTILDMLSTGDYAKKLRETYTDDNGMPIGLPDELTLTYHNLTLRGYIDGKINASPVVWKDVDNDDNRERFIFLSGGAMANIPGEPKQEFVELPLIPISNLRLDLTSKIDVTFDDKTHTFDANLNVYFESDIVRDYLVGEGVDIKTAKPTKYHYDEWGEIVVDEFGTKCLDTVKTMVCKITESNKFDGASNVSLIDCDLSSTLRAIFDQRIGYLENDDFLAYETLEKKKVYTDASDLASYGKNPRPIVSLMNYKILGSDALYWYKVIPGFKDTAGDDDEAIDQRCQVWLESWLNKDKFELNHDFNDANKGADSIRDTIDGKTGTNGMMIVGIVIAVIVILALVALWYFKFKPEELKAAEKPQE